MSWALITEANIKTAEVTMIQAQIAARGAVIGTSDQETKLKTYVEKRNAFESLCYGNGMSTRDILNRIYQSDSTKGEFTMTAFQPIANDVYNTLADPTYEDDGIWLDALCRTVGATQDEQQEHVMNALDILLEDGCVEFVKGKWRLRIPALDNAEYPF